MSFDASFRPPVQKERYPASNRRQRRNSKHQEGTTSPHPRRKLEFVRNRKVKHNDARTTKRWLGQNSIRDNENRERGQTAHSRQGHRAGLTLRGPSFVSHP